MILSRAIQLLDSWQCYAHAPLLQPLPHQPAMLAPWVPMVPPNLQGRDGGRKQKLKEGGESGDAAEGGRGQSGDAAAAAWAGPCGLSIRTAISIVLGKVLNWHVK